MHSKIPSIICGAAILMASTMAQAVQVNSFATSFSASENLYQGSPFPSGGFDESFNTGGAIGFSGFAKANTGIATANVNGSLSATYDEVINPGSTDVKLNFIGSGSSFGSDFGAGVGLNAFINTTICLGLPTPFGCGGVNLPVNESIPVAGLGFLLEPGNSFTGNLVPSPTRNSTASDDADVAGVGLKNIPLLGDIGPTATLIVDQTIGLSTNTMTGLLAGVNRNNGNAIVRNFAIGSSDMTNVNLAGLDAGIWDFSVLDLDLFGRFYNAATLAIKLAIAIPIISDIDIAQFNIVTLNNDFAMDFNQIDQQNLFSILVTPIPAAVWLFGTALIGFISFARRRAVA